MIRRDPSPVAGVWLRLERPEGSLTLIGWDGPGTEQEANRTLRLWSEQIAATDPGMVIVADVSFENGYTCHNRHHLRHLWTDGTIRGRALADLHKHRWDSYKHPLKQGGSATNSEVTTDLEGLPPHPAVAGELKKWAMRRSATGHTQDDKGTPAAESDDPELRRPLEEGEAEYCAELNYVLDEDYPLLEAAAVAEQRLAPLWEGDLEMCAAIHRAHDRAESMIRKFSNQTRKCGSEAP